MIYGCAPWITAIRFYPDLVRGKISCRGLGQGSQNFLSALFDLPVGGLNVSGSSELFRLMD